MDLIGAQEIRLECNDTLEIENCTLFYGKGNIKHQLGTGLFLHRQIRSADKFPCIILIDVILLL
jgi:hypothetical protein